jgi:hypothetical protein
MYAITALLRCEGAVEDKAAQVGELGAVDGNEDGESESDVGEPTPAPEALGVDVSTTLPVPARPQAVGATLRNATARATDHRRSFEWEI